MKTFYWLGPECIIKYGKLQDGVSGSRPMSQFPDPWFNFTLTNINLHIMYKFIIFIMCLTISKMIPVSDLQAPGNTEEN